jgi:PAS domain S-box-containing protein
MAVPRSRTAEARWIGIVPVAVFVLSSALMLYWWSTLVDAQRKAIDEHFRSDARRVATKVEERLDAYDQILRGVAGLFAASEEVSRDEFRRYFEKLQIGRAYKGIQGVGFVAWIPPDRLEAHVRAVRAEGFPGYDVKPPGPRAEYTSVVYLEPFTSRNRRAFGLDGFVEPVRRSAMARARDRGELTTSAKVTLAQETETDVQPGVLTFLPVYRQGKEPSSEAERRATLEGWVYSPLRMGDLTEGILGAEPGTIRLEIFDGDQETPEHLLYDSRPGEKGPVVFSSDLPMKVNQRVWTLRFTAGEPFLLAARPRNPWVEFAVMAVLVALLTGLSTALVASLRLRQREAGLARSLRESESRYRAIFERAPVGIFTFDPDGRFLSANPRYCEITGWSLEELRGMTREEIVHPADRAQDAELLARLRAGERSTGTLERRGIRKDGTTFWAEVTLSLEAPGRESPGSFVGVLDDVTARHEADEKFRVIAERSLAGIVLLQDERIVYANPAMGEIAGLPVDDLTGMTTKDVWAMILDEDRPLVKAAADEAGVPVAGTIRPVAYRVARPSGAVRRVEQMARPIRHLGRPAMLVFVLDVTERERTEEEIRKAQRLESLGLLAGGIAHDFNNLLTAVFGQVEEARGQLTPESAPARELDVALSALTRSRDLTRQLLTFSTGGAPERRILAVGKLVEDAVRLGLGGSTIRSHIELASDLPPIEADEGQMSQLLNNLLVNARQATTGAGEVTIRASRRMLGTGEVPPLPAGAYVQISIQDTGEGIPEHLLSKVFDPFFTTRTTGTGLGLATSYSIVRRHGGHIGIASRMGEGTTVTLLLPAADGQPAERAMPAPVPAPLRRLRVLLMDDEPLVLKVGVKHLRKLGFDVETAVTGEEAVKAYRRMWSEGIPPDVAILDLTVPGGMGGAEALDRIREIDPGAAAIACSGYFEDGIMADPARFGFAGVLGKPYLTADMERVLAEVARRER